MKVYMKDSWLWRAVLAVLLCLPPLAGVSSVPVTGSGLVMWLSLEGGVP